MSHPMPSPQDGPAPQAGRRAVSPAELAKPDFDLVIFDCDGVLIDSEMLSCECLRDILCEHGLAIDLDGCFERFLGRSFSVVADHYRQALGRPLDEGFTATHRGRLRDRFAQALRLMPGIADVLERLAAPCCVASSSDGERLRYSLRLTGLAERFGPHVYSSELVANGKPAPDLFLLAAGRMGAEPARTLVIEDSVNGVLAGKRAGMTVWGFVGGSHYGGREGAALLRAAGADRIVHAMADLPAL